MLATQTSCLQTKSAHGRFRKSYVYLESCFPTTPLIGTTSAGTVTVTASTTALACCFQRHRGFSSLYHIRDRGRAEIPGCTLLVCCTVYMGFENNATKGDAKAGRGKHGGTFRKKGACFELCG